jgi:hypothetical protein
MRTNLSSVVCYSTVDLKVWFCSAKRPSWIVTWHNFVCDGSIFELMAPEFASTILLDQISFDLLKGVVAAIVYINHIILKTILMLTKSDLLFVSFLSFF